MIFSVKHLKKIQETQNEQSKIDRFFVEYRFADTFIFLFSQMHCLDLSRNKNIDNDGVEFLFDCLDNIKNLSLGACSITPDMKLELFKRGSVTKYCNILVSCWIISASRKAEIPNKIAIANFLALSYQEFTRFFILNKKLTQERPGKSAP